MANEQNKTPRPIVVGKKAVANYALAIATRLGEGQKTITLRARGRLIGLAFDAANMAVNMHQPVERGEVSWGQETAPGGAGKMVSYVEIEMVGKEA